MTLILGVAAPRILQGAALLAALAGVLFWSSLLLTPAQSNTPVMERSTPIAGIDTPALQWFSNQPVAMEVEVSGVIAGAQGAVAIISLNGGPPRGVLAGERLAPGVRLLAIEGDAVILERGSQPTRLKISPLPDVPTLPRLIRP
ncbi:MULTISPECIES: general secretion pathway protein GspC [Pseudomonas]|uniref:general secretion pathway protein GspC n=1 Tax=Pseudomonas TaxID=286 RepID=UPI00235F166D|nr:general secretion pathway protein GspC [Pseudomonas asplenii]